MNNPSDPAVRLDDLNEKLRPKEFKSTQKDLKAKDDAVKLAAIKKVAQELRYFSEGACVAPLILSLIPKKV
jgi:hypothetical protein